MEIKIRAITEKGKLAMQEIYKQSQKMSGKKAGKTIELNAEPYSLVIYPITLKRYPNSIKPMLKNSIEASMKDMFAEFDVEINKDYEVE